MNSVNIIVYGMFFYRHPNQIGKLINASKSLAYLHLPAIIFFYPRVDLYLFGTDYKRIIVTFHKSICDYQETT